MAEVLFRDQNQAQLDRALDGVTHHMALRCNDDGEVIRGRVKTVINSEGSLIGFPLDHEDGMTESEHIKQLYARMLLYKEKLIEWLLDLNDSKFAAQAYRV